MNTSECTICKHYGKPTLNPEELERELIFDEVGTSVPLLLCRKHAVDLFKMGQKSFLIFHYKILVDILSSEEVKFLDILEKTVRKHFDEIF